MNDALSKRLDKLEASARQAHTLPPDPAEMEHIRERWRTIVELYPIPNPDPSASMASRIAAAAAAHPELRAVVEGWAAREGDTGELGRYLLRLADRMATDLASAAERAS